LWKIIGYTKVKNKPSFSLRFDFSLDIEEADDRLVAIINRESLENPLDYELNSALNSEISSLLLKLDVPSFSSEKKPHFDTFIDGYSL